MTIMWLYKYAKRRTTSIFTISVVRLFMFNHNRSSGKRGLHFQMTDLRLSRSFCVSTNHHFLSVDNVDAFGGWSGYAAALQVVPYGCGSVIAFDAFNARRVNIVVLAVVIVAHVAIAVGSCLNTLKQIVGAGEILVGDVATLAVDFLNQSVVIVKTVCYCIYYGLIAVVDVGNDIAILVIPVSYTHLTLPTN